MDPPLLSWREDGRCDLPAPDGTAVAQCNPFDSLGRTCCAADGECAAAASISACIGVDYRIRRRWRDDGRCGADVRGADGILGAICNPLHPHNVTCCSEEGFCGAWPSYAHCRCKDCVNHHAVCTCSAETPCQDAATGRCYPRTQKGDERDDLSRTTAMAVDSNGRPHDPRHLSKEFDRRPEQDPRVSMRDADLRKRFDRHNAPSSSSDSAPLAPPDQRPIVDGMRCAVLLVDCVGNAAPEPPALPAARRELQAANNTANGTRAIRPFNASDAPQLESPTSPPPEAPRSPPEPVAPPPSAPPLPIRLANGQRPREGRLELLYNGTWGSVCGNKGGFGWTAAHVACRSLGFGGVESVSNSAAYGESPGPILLSHVDCEGTEERLEHCRFYGLGESTIPPACVQHSFDVGLQCSRQRMPVPERVPLPEHEAGSALPQSIGGATGELSSALDALEGVIGEMERRRPIIEEAHVARLSRLRLRLRRLAGLPGGDAAPCVCGVNAAATNGSSVVNASASRETTERDTPSVSEETARRLGISEATASRLPPDMLEELKRMPRKEDSRPLHEARAEFEARQREENFDPLENDPVEQVLRLKREQYVAPGLKPAPLVEPKPHEKLRKPPIQNLANRKPPPWQEAYQARYEHTMEQIRLGLAPEGIMRTLGPGPWDHDPSFWRDPHEREVLLEHELDEDIVFD